MTVDQLVALGANKHNAHKYVAELNKTLQKYRINTPLRMAHFLAQVFHESGCLRYSEELASGEAYEGRKDLGNVLPGDGKLFKGRGLLQITGRLVYINYGASIGENIAETPEVVAEPHYACDSAGWYWSEYKKNKEGLSLNNFADEDLFLKITYMINGGFNGLQDRMKLLKKAYSLFNISNGGERLKKIVKECENNLQTNPRVRHYDKMLFKAVPDISVVFALNKIAEEEDGGNDEA